MKTTEKPKTEPRQIEACVERDCKFHDDNYDNGCFMYGKVSACEGKRTEDDGT